jgi:hypothetical protein
MTKLATTKAGSWVFSDEEVAEPGVQLPPVQQDRDTLSQESRSSLASPRTRAAGYTQGELRGSKAAAFSCSPNDELDLVAFAKPSEPARKYADLVRARGAAGGTAGGVQTSSELSTGVDLRARCESGHLSLTPDRNVDADERLLETEPQLPAVAVQQERMASILEATTLLRRPRSISLQITGQEVYSKTELQQMEVRTRVAISSCLRMLTRRPN